MLRRPPLPPKTYLYLLWLRKRFLFMLGCAILECWSAWNLEWRSPGVLESRIPGVLARNVGRLVLASAAPAAGFFIQQMKPIFLKVLPIANPKMERKTNRLKSKAKHANIIKPTKPKEKRKYNEKPRRPIICYLFACC